MKLKLKLKLPSALADFDKPKPRKPLPTLPSNIHFVGLEEFTRIFGADVEDFAVEWPLSLRPLTDIEFRILQARDPWNNYGLPSGLTTLYYSSVAMRRPSLTRVTGYQWSRRRQMLMEGLHNGYLLMTTRPLTKLWKSGDEDAIKRHLTQKFGWKF